MNKTRENFPLVSVIIPCFNHGEYLQEAIDSIKNQNYPSIEIIVVDDGSKDNTSEIAKVNKDVIYIYQSNQGLSAARNTGIDKSIGEYLLFLDADDWLYPEAINTNISYLLKDKSLAFASGYHEKVFTEKNITLQKNYNVESDHFLHLLQHNYIGMHATVLFRRFVFNEFNFDTKLKACEDYDLYLHIVKKYPVIHHGGLIAAYRLHGLNMSGNIPFMLETALNVLDRHGRDLNAPTEIEAYKKGKTIWKNYYIGELYKKLLVHPKFASKKELFTLLKYSKKLGIKYLYTRIIT